VILCVGGTPAMQRTLLFDRLDVGEVNRAREVRVTASGKVTNAARAATVLGGRALLLTFLGGDSGRFVARELEAAGVPHEPVWVDAPTRVCATLVEESGRVTELVEEGGAVPGEKAADLERLALEKLREAEALCLIGSLPPGVPEDLYAVLTKAARDAGVPALVDAQKGLLRAALEARPFLVKPNLEETANTLDLPLSDDGEADARKAASSLREAGAEWALVSTGRAGSVLAGPDGEWRVEPPLVEAVNPIGSGDVMAAGLLRSLTQGATVPDAAVFGTGCAAANVLTPTSGEIYPDDIEELLPRVRLTRLG
jgi:tagatose 6-phosphate kinase